MKFQSVFGAPSNDQVSLTARFDWPWLRRELTSDAMALGACLAALFLVSLSNRTTAQAENTLPAEVLHTTLYGTSTANNYSIPDILGETPCP